MEAPACPPAVTPAPDTGGAPILADVSGSLLIFWAPVKKFPSINSLSGL